MSLDRLVKELETLSVDDLLTLQEQVTHQLRAKVRVADDYTLPTPNLEQTELELSELFGEEWPAIKADLELNGLNNLPVLPKSFTEYLLEEREAARY